MQPRVDRTRRISQPRPIPADTRFDHFAKELNRLVESFGQRLAELTQPGYAEAQLRDDFLNPFFRALGWDMENRAGLIQPEREVEIESATQIGSGRKRADYHSGKAVLQNAVTATDQQIDQLVYELDDLTPEEIALVEGAQGRARHSVRAVVANSRGGAQGTDAPYQCPP